MNSSTTAMNCVFRYRRLREHRLSWDSEHRFVQIDAIQAKHNRIHYIHADVLDVYEACN